MSITINFLMIVIRKIRIILTLRNTLIFFLDNYFLTRNFQEKISQIIFLARILKYD